MSRTDNDNRVAVDDGGSTTEENVITGQDPAGPGELVLHGGLTSHYPRVNLTTAWHQENFIIAESQSHLTCL